LPGYKYEKIKFLRVTRLSLFRNKGDYGVGLASSRGCSGNGLSYVQESDKALPRKRFGHGTLRQAQGVILSNAEGWQDPLEFLLGICLTRDIPD
jgi:hypothetical protein